MQTKILFFIDSLSTGGKERRLVELLYFLCIKTSYSIHLVLSTDVIHYEYVRELNIPITVIERGRFKKDPTLFFKFYKIVKSFQPDIIHTWGPMTTIYAIPSKLLLKKILIASLISNVKVEFKKSTFHNFVFKLNCFYSDVILSNSKAGLLAYNVPSGKAHLIYNGVRLERFAAICEPPIIRQDIGIDREYSVIMVASMTKNKNYDLFIDVAKNLPDISFVAVGDGPELPRLKKRVHEEKIKNIIFLGKRSDIEPLICSADIGMLLTHSEGISNTIMEYMALGKPVITTDILGGSKELVIHGKGGYIIKNELNEVSQKILELLQKEMLRKTFGEFGKRRIAEHFSLERMGNEFCNLYEGKKLKKETFSE